MGSVLRDGRDEGRFTVDQVLKFYSSILVLSFPGDYQELFGRILGA